MTGPDNARDRYEAFTALKRLAAQKVNKTYGHGRFKLICDDLGLANLILTSEDDFTVVEVVDFEWSYVGPAQMAATAPWWLLQDRPINQEWDCNKRRAAGHWCTLPHAFEVYNHVLREEEVKQLGPGSNVFSELVQWSQDSGAMWLHMVLACAFNDPQTFPFAQLRRHVGADNWEKLEEIDERDLDAFLKKKVLYLEQYDVALDAIEDDEALVDDGKLSRYKFMDQHGRLLLLESETAKASGE